jgi:hypothetical protein
MKMADGGFRPACLGLDPGSPREAWRVRVPSQMRCAAHGHGVSEQRSEKPERR